MMDKNKPDQIEGLDYEIQLTEDRIAEMNLYLSGADSPGLAEYYNGAIRDLETKLDNLRQEKKKLLEDWTPTGQAEE